MLIQHLLQQGHPGVKLSFFLDGLENDYFSFVYLAFGPWIHNAMERRMLSLIKGGEILIPRVIVQLREYGFHVRGFERVES